MVEKAFFPYFEESARNTTLSEAWIMFLFSSDSIMSELVMVSSVYAAAPIK